MATPSARERILDTAARLFYQDGLRATGIDKIIAESGVAKMSLYRHFASKNELIAAFLDRRHESWMRWFEQDVEARFAASPGLEAIALALADWFSDEGFSRLRVYQCGGGGGRLRRGARQVAQSVAHKAELAALIGSLARRLGLPEPDAIAEEAMLCVEGMIVRYQMTADPGVVDAGRRLLRRLQQVR